MTPITNHTHVAHLLRGLSDMLAMVRGKVPFHLRMMASRLEP